jgi:hypothetical protein
MNLNIPLARSTTTIKYKDYKFFTVETNIDIKRP